MKQMSALTASTRKSGLDPLVSIGLAAVLVFFLISGGIAYLNIRTLREDNQMVVHSHQVIITLDGLLSTVRDAETGQRGFLLTDNEHYLEPYNAALLTATSQLDELSQLTRDNPQQQDRIGPLKLHIEAKLAELKQTIDLRRTAGRTRPRSPWSRPTVAKPKWIQSAPSSRPWIRKKPISAKSGSPKWPMRTRRHSSAVFSLVCSASS